jgi:hypothetical protein
MGVDKHRWLFLRWPSGAHVGTCKLADADIIMNCEQKSLDPTDGWLVQMLNILSLALSLAAVTNAYLSTDQRLLQECASWMLRAEAALLQ